MCISCGTCNKRYFKYMAGVIIIIILSLGLLFVVYFNHKRREIRNLDLLSFSFFGSLCETLMIIPYLILKKNISSEKNEEISPKNNKYSIKYIFNENSKQFSLKEKAYFIAAVFLKIILDIVFSIYLFYQVLYLKVEIFELLTYTFQFELLFLFLSSKFMYSIPFYKHQYISIIILTLSGLAKLIINCYDSGILSIFVYFIIDIFYSFFKSILTVYIKGLMEYKYISPYKTCFIFGLFSFIIITIIYIISSLCPCDDDNFICIVEYEDKKYFGNILSIFNITSLLSFSLYLLKAVLLVFNYIIIHSFTVCHSFLVIELTHILQIVGLMIFKKSYVLDISILLLSFLNFFFILLFLEIIEINIWNISYNTTKNIESRAILDKVISDIVSEGNTDDEEEIEEDNVKNKKMSLTLDKDNEVK